LHGLVSQIREVDLFFVVNLWLSCLCCPVHEGTLVTALATLSLWCAKFATEVPTKLTEWFKVGKLCSFIVTRKVM